MRLCLVAALPVHLFATVAATGAQCPPAPAELEPALPPQMCEVCDPPALTPEEQCIYNDTDCMALAPGACCQLGCHAPYVGTSITVCCTADVNLPGGRSLNLTKADLPTCDCPQPPPAEGYTKEANDTEWTCTGATHHGTAQIGCTTDSSLTPTDSGTPLGCPAVVASLSGCNALVPCAYPQLDECRYNATQCGSVQPGGSCHISCKAPFNPGTTTAVCPATNIDVYYPLEYQPLRCILENCADPDPIPAGYNKSAAGVWQCDTGYSGTAVATCAPSESWSPGSSLAHQCTAVVTLQGCDKILPCTAPVLNELDKCTYDLNSCYSVDPGGTCSVFCKEPFVGVTTVASCPSNNTIVGGLTWAKPECSLTTCADPEIIPQGYMRSTLTSNGWDCAQSYTGVAVKSCTVNSVCITVPVLSGCQQLTPCKSSLLNVNSCMFDFYGCASVQPGQACELRCRAPFAGTVTTAECPQGNTDPMGLLWTPPTCLSSDCMDPQPTPPGYVKVGSGATATWMCDDGYAGEVNVTCSWNAAACQYDASLGGCEPELPCPFPKLDLGEACMTNLTKCPGGGGELVSGASCPLFCKAPYFSTGADGFAECPPGNLDPTQEAVLTLPACSCPDPLIPPKGYAKSNSTNQWQCDIGYAGTAEKLCFPDPSVTNSEGQPCQITAVLTGCGLPLPCDVAPFVDTGSGKGTLSGTLRFGRSFMLNSLDESYIVDYRVYFADECNKTIGEPIAIVNKTMQDVSCCRPDSYTVNLEEVKVPVELLLDEAPWKLLIRAGLFYGDSLSYRIVQPNLTAVGSSVLTSGAAKAREACSFVMLGGVLFAWLGGAQAFLGRD